MGTTACPPEETLPETIRKRNLEKKWLPCLGCGRSMYTDCCHRFCRKCRRRRRRTPDSFLRSRVCSLPEH
jgi:hypothetical protein